MFYFSNYILLLVIIFYTILIYVYFRIDTMKKDIDIFPTHIPIVQKRIKELIDEKKLLKQGLNIKAMLENSYNSKQEQELILIKNRILEINKELRKYKNQDPN